MSDSDLENRKLFYEIRKLKQEESDAELARQKSQIELRKLKREEKFWSRFWSFMSGSIALCAMMTAVGSLGVSYIVWWSGLEKTRAETESLKIKEFYDLIQAAADQKRDKAERIGVLWGLQGFWWDKEDTNRDPKVAAVLAHTFSSILVNDENPYVMEASVDAIGHAYQDPNIDLPPKDKEWIKSCLYGDVSKPHKVGAVLQHLKQALGRKPEEDKQHDQRLSSFAQAIKTNDKDLNKVNFQGVQFADLGLNLADANLNGCDLSNADLGGRNFSNAHLSNADLRKANLMGCNLSHADLSHADLRGALLNWGTQFDGANLEGAKTSDHDFEKRFKGFSGTVSLQP